MLANLFRLPTVTGMSRLSHNSQSLNISSSTLSAGLSCYEWNRDHYCFLGSSIFSLHGGKAEHFLSGLPVGPDDQIQVN